MASRLKPLELVRAAVIARRYFIEGRSKTEIAEEFGLSRFKVARSLDQARASGLVRIEIGLPAELDAELSDRLRAAYGLHHALVVTTSDEPEAELRTHLGEVAAGLLSELVVEGDVLGIGWGRSLTATTLALTALAHCTVVQLTGAVGSVGMTEDSVETVRAVAAISGGPAFPIYAPLILDAPDTAAAIRRQPHVAEAIRRFDLLTKALVAIGSWDPPNSQLREALSAADRQSLESLHVRAEICATMIDDSGSSVAPDLVERSIAISAAQLLRVPEVIAVAGGRSKTAAIAAVLKAGIITSLVTDVAVARALLHRAGTDPASTPSARDEPRARQRED
jgi:DNA-binding transcriptional regulator LsrR (DeoR family)